ncbi:Origin recognition complex, subunit 2 family-containing protein [Strongyloides ratti]|uniref:Origin recognition complex subunit 2 n=1 Tax=Strongyloides ratti TaxID=34506 RepID=A0A090L3W0_STRRB|nr:Origin recognition complex, subunit 2 family-containing protein [Strongyloides ratti]CEF62772.1 Origin recognition complex, subunit 2 family-containing protein [Strongyloides ratti]
MAPELQYREVNEKLFYNTNFPYKEISVILNTGPSIFRNIVIYGIGDKSEILENLRDNYLSKIKTIFFEANSIRFRTRMFLDAINEECKLNIIFSKNDFLQYANMIKDEIDKRPKTFSLALLINNCDNDELIYDTAFHDCLKIICSKKKVFFIATCTYPLFPPPGSSAREDLRCYFLKFSTFNLSVNYNNKDDAMDLDDDDEVTHKVESIKVVYDSLTSNTKKLFVLMMQQFIKNNFKSIFSDDVFLSAKDRFWVNSVSQMQEMITEFLDHKFIEKCHDLSGKIKYSLRIKRTVLNDFMESEGIELEDEDDDE